MGKTIKKSKTLSLLVALALFGYGIYENPDLLVSMIDQEVSSTDSIEIIHTESQTYLSLSDIPDYSGSPYVIVNDNEPFFLDSEMTTTSFEEYAPLDDLGRCGIALASVGVDIMPTEDRGSISSVYPTAWHSIKYDNVPSQYLYNKCHLLGFQLTGENANKNNLITGTRQLNVNAMLPFENMIADYVQSTNNHVYYRVTPIFEDNNLLANGVLMEAKSVEDDGEGVLFNIFCYNNQEGITIDYIDGTSSSIYGNII